MIKFRFELPQLGYQLGDLAPMMSQETVALHYDRHFRTYLDNLNRLLEGSVHEGLSLSDIVRRAPIGPLSNNAGQVYNHQLFFEQFVPSKNAKQPSGEFLFLVEQSFGSFDHLLQSLEKESMSFFGSGWTFLAVNSEGELKVLSLSNGDTPLRYGMTPLLAIDLWEHAYYLDYQNRKRDYLSNLFLIINWKVVSSRLPL
jgi:Fe-Mn family superoxide dismutase